jgi:hypothetical protein
VPEEAYIALRELLVRGNRIVYEVRSDDVVVILMVWHGARRLPELPES